MVAVREIKLITFPGLAFKAITAPDISGPDVWVTLTSVTEAPFILKVTELTSEVSSSHIS